MPLQKYEYIRNMDIFQKFINRADRIEVKSNKWFETEIENFWYTVHYTDDCNTASRCQIDHNSKRVTIEEFSGEISYRNRFTLAMAISWILIYLSDKELTWLIGILWEKADNDTLNREEFLKFHNIWSEIRDFAGKILISRTFARKIFEKYDESLSIFASYFCASEPCASKVLLSYWLRKPELQTFLL